MDVATASSIQRFACEIPTLIVKSPESTLPHLVLKVCSEAVFVPDLSLTDPKTGPVALKKQENGSKFSAGFTM